MDVIERLTAALNTGDLDALVACFTSAYRNETPAHPSRGFVGSDQVRRNWTQIFSSVRDLRAAIVRQTGDADAAWVEWDWTGSRGDGLPLAMRGVTILGLEDDRIAWARFYMEPVDPESVDVATAVDRTVGRTP